MTEADTHIRHRQNKIASTAHAHQRAAETKLLEMAQEDRRQLQVSFNAAVIDLRSLLQRLRVQADADILSSAVFIAAEQYFAER
ncbi:hypothetical protein HDV00_010668 [Rhizophlyctis rosea]|nr:hypothetical protein HDV00_010668 [Rhizophlyctis rosea]